MKDQELRDLFHAYRPELGDEEAFMARLNEQIESLSPTLSQGKGVRLPLLWKGKGRFIWAAGIAAAIIMALIIIKPTKETVPVEAAAYPANTDYQAFLAMTSSFPTFEETVAEIEQSGRQLEQTIAELKK